MVFVILLWIKKFYKSRNCFNGIFMAWFSLHRSIEKFFLELYEQIDFGKNTSIFGVSQNVFFCCFGFFDSINNFWICSQNPWGEKYCHFQEISWASTRYIKEIVVFSWSRFLIYILNLIVLFIIFSLRKKNFFVGIFETWQTKKTPKRSNSGSLTKKLSIAGSAKKTI